MHVLVTGARGLVGAALTPCLESAGHRLTRLVRRAPSPGEARWDPATGIEGADSLAPVDAVIHLAGESIAGGRWTKARMARIRDSRVRGTQALVESIGRLVPPPRVLVSASAVGFYGDRGDERLDERSPAGSGFLAGVAVEWEAAAERASAFGTRVVRVRTGIVLTTEGGALGRMLPLFRLGLGGPLGDGRAFWSWITLEDLVRVYEFALGDERARGAVNATAPEPVRNEEFTRVLARLLRRPARLPAPAAALRLVFGKMADEALLASVRALPRRLEEWGFELRGRDVESALRRVLAAGDSLDRA